MEIDLNNLPQDAATLRSLVTSLIEDRTAQDRRIRQLQHMLEQLLRARYGPRRERLNENQLFLFAAEILKNDTKDPAPKDRQGSDRPKTKGHGRQRLPKSLRRQRVVFDLAEHQKQCPECQEKLQRIGEEVSERLEYVPVSMVVIEEACQKYACKNGCTVVTAEKPIAPIEKGLPGPGLLAHVVVSKYADHLPLHRQEAIFRRPGVTLSRKTMCDWMRQCSDLVSPLYDRMKQNILGSKVMQTDDTPVNVLDASLPRARIGRIWTYVGDRDHPYTVYDFTPTRSRDGPDAFMKDFHGYLQADAYSGYDELYRNRDRNITEVACWAHVRRRYFEAQSPDLMRSTVMLAYIRLLYDVEREQPAVLPKSPEGMAMSYTLSNWDALVRYCRDGDLEIDNNGAERSLRGIAVGRKNWNFYGSNEGGKTAAVLTSITATCKRLRVDPFEYLRDVFQRISTYPQNNLDNLLPDKWEAARAAATSNS